MVPVSASNPFSASSVRPGALPFLFQEGSLVQIVSRFQRFGCRGQIVGPHGSGKSTLLLAMIQHLRDSGLHVSLVRLPARDGPSFPHWARELRRRARSNERSLLAVDGWDQLSALTRLLVQLWVRVRQRGLLITTHRPARLPILISTAATPAIASEVVALLLEKADLSADQRQAWHTRMSAELPELLAKHHGNLREVLFELYDRFDRPAAESIDQRSGKSLRE